MKYLTVKELCEKFGFSPSWIYKACGKRELPHFQPSKGRLYFIEDEINAWIEKGRIEMIDKNGNIIN